VLEEVRQHTIRHLGLRGHAGTFPSQAETPLLHAAPIIASLFWATDRRSRQGIGGD
jgi:hypothetical protein